MIRDLPANASNQQYESDVLVIGAGMAGLLVATRLAEKGIRVLVAESGTALSDSSDDLNLVEQTGDINSSAHMRSRALGGTSLLWGGAMIPFRQSELDLARWPIDWSEFERYVPAIEQLFHLPPGPYDQESPYSSDFIIRSAKWPLFKRRNIASLLSRQIHANNGPEIWLDATATRFELSPNGNITHVDFRSCSKNHARVSARRVVIAAGAIESTRLLLTLDRQHDERIFAPDGMLGRFLHDHLTYPIGQIVGESSRHLARFAGMKFEKTGMQKRRFQPSVELRRNGIPAGYINVDFAGHHAPAFSKLRSVFRHSQRKDGIPVSDIVGLLRHLPWLTRAAWWRFAERRLIFPDGLQPQFWSVVEQTPKKSNRIALSDSGRDMFGCPLASLHWQVDEDDAAGFRNFSAAFSRWWNSTQLSPLGRIVLDIPSGLRDALARTGGSNHLGGGIRLGADPRSGVVDRKLATFRVPNLWVVSTAVFPSAAGVNPTMTLMLAALRLADNLAGATRNTAAGTMKQTGGDPADVRSERISANT